MATPSRRQFLTSVTTAGAAIALPRRTLLAAPASEQVNIGIIGCGWRGGSLLKYFRDLPGVNIAGLCDVDQELLDTAAKGAPKAKKWTDMRQLLASPDIDAVVIATCNHWHCLAAIWAMEAGKHVYVEKPLGHTQWEGDQVVNASKKYKRICQVGTQQRSDPMQLEIKQFLHDEKALGEIESVRVNRFGVREPIGRRSTPFKPQSSVDYNLWLGPAQDIAIYRDKLHYDWHWVWNTGSGEMGNWGVHVMDDVRNNVFRDTVAAPTYVTAGGGRFLWNDAGETPNVHFALLEASGIPVVVALSNLPTDRMPAKIPGPGSGYVVYCAGGRLQGQRGSAVAFDAAGRQIKKFRGNSGEKLHQQNFIDAIRSDQPSLLAASAQVGNDSTRWCNLINIATRVPAASTSTSVTDDVKRFGKVSAAEIFQQMEGIIAVNDRDKSAPRLQLGPTLHFDASRSQFVDDHADSANQLLQREYRKPFLVPEVHMPRKTVSAS